MKIRPLHDRILVERGWVCRQCHSTVGAVPKADLIEEGL